MVSDRVKRINVLGVPVDILAKEDIEPVIKEMASDGMNHQIVLLSTSDLIKARSSPEFRTMVTGASLVIPISLKIIKTAKFLKRDLPIRYEPFEFIVLVLLALERWNKSVYLFGGSQKGVIKAAKNIKTTFPKLKVVGGHSAKIQKSSMMMLVESIRKATPSLLLIGQGVPGNEKWIPRNMKHFNSGIQMWCSDVFEVFAERKHRPPAGLFKNGFEWIYYFVQKPWLIFRLFSYFILDLVALWYKIRKR